MYLNLGYSDIYIENRVNELLREAERDRLADLAQGPRRSVRVRVAEWLFALAAWVEGTPQGSVARAEA
jgi:hypothetical protein